MRWQKEKKKKWRYIRNHRTGPPSKRAKIKSNQFTTLLNFPFSSLECYIERSRSFFWCSSSKPKALLWALCCMFCTERWQVALWWSKTSLNVIGGPDEGLQSRSKRNRVANSVCDRQGLHVLGDAVYVGDVRSFLWVRVDAHIYQFSQLVEKKDKNMLIHNTDP